MIYFPSFVGHVTRVMVRLASCVTTIAIEDVVAPNPIASSNSNEFHFLIRFIGVVFFLSFKPVPWDPIPESNSIENTMRISILLIAITQHRSQREGRAIDYQRWCQSRARRSSTSSSSSLLHSDRGKFVSVRCAVTTPAAGEKRRRGRNA